MPTASGRAPKQRGHGGHHDRTEAQQTGLINRLLGRQAFLALSGKREVDHHYSVLLHDPDQQDDADQRHQIQILMEQHHRQQCANAGGRQRRKDGDGMNIAFVQHAKHDVDRDNCGEDQERLAFHRRNELGGAADQRCPGLHREGRWRLGCGGPRRALGRVKRRARD